MSPRCLLRLLLSLLLPLLLAPMPACADPPPDPGETRAFISFSRVKTFRQTDDRDLFQFGLLKAY